MGLRRKSSMFLLALLIHTWIYETDPYASSGSWGSEECHRWRFVGRPCRFAPICDLGAFINFLFSLNNQYQAVLLFRFLSTSTTHDPTLVGRESTTFHAAFGFIFKK